MADKLTNEIFGAAIEVHRHLGPGLLESIYESALCHEFTLRSIQYDKQKHIDIIYKGMPIKGQRIDLIVENRVILELKAVEQINPVYISQAISYMRATNIRTALIINFNARRLVDGIKRISL